MGIEEVLQAEECCEQLEFISDCALEHDLPGCLELHSAVELFAEKNFPGIYFSKSNLEPKEADPSESPLERGY